MKLIINGKEETLEREKLFVSELLKIKDVKIPEMVSVQLNGGFVKREIFSHLSRHRGGRGFRGRAKLILRGPLVQDLDNTLGKL